MMMRKNAMILAASVLCIAFGMASAAAETEREHTQNTEVTEIATADELKAVNDNLSGNYVLTADIDLEGAEWTPLGSFVQMGAEGEEAETPDPEYAFTGTQEKMELKKCRVDSKYAAFALQGSCIFQGLRIDGFADIRSILLPNGQSLAAGVYLKQLENGTNAIIPRLSLGAQQFKDVSMTIVPAQNEINFTNP